MTSHSLAVGVTSDSRARSGAWTLALLALLVLACREVSAPTIQPPVTQPDAGPQLAYVEWSDGNGAIFLVDSAGATRRLSSLGAWDTDPAWSPDGSSIAFTSGENFSTDIYIMDASGGNRVRLTTDGSGNSRPAWSHDGARIAFVSKRDGNSEIYVMNADGSHQSRLTFRDDSYDTAPAWSPDGTRIAFATSDAGGGILVITADGTETVRLTSGYIDTTPAWSPDGSRIAFASQTGETSRIFVMDADGSGRAQYSPHGFSATDPSWSPDGNRIAFVAIELCDFWDYYSDCGSRIFIRSWDGATYIMPKENYSFPSDPTWRP